MINLLKEVILVSIKDLKTKSDMIIIPDELTSDTGVQQVSFSLKDIDKPKETNPFTSTPEPEEVESETEMIPLYTMEYLDEHWNELDHDLMWRSQRFTVDFLKKHMFEIDWGLLALNVYLNFEILDEFKNVFSWATVSLNIDNYDVDFAEKIMYHYRNYIFWDIALSRTQLRLKHLIIMSELFRKSKSKAASKFWKAVSSYQKIDIEYVDAYKRFINFIRLTKNPYLTNDIIYKYADRLDIQTLVSARTIPDNILAKHENLFRAYLT